MTNKVTKDKDPEHRTYVSFYDEPDGQGNVIGRCHIDLPIWNQRVFNMSHKNAQRFSAKSFALFNCMRVVNVEVEEL